MNKLRQKGLIRIITIFALAVSFRSKGFAAVPQAESIAESIQKIKDKFGIDVSLSAPRPSDFRTRIKPLKPPAIHLQKYLDLFYAELFRYSPGLLRASGLKTIAPVGDLVGGAGEWSQYVYDFKTNTLYCNVSIEGLDNYIRHTFHHELAHAIDWRLNGLLYRDDPAWQLMNAPSFRYAASGWQMRANYSPDHQDASPGFFTLYSKADAREDKAEVFAGLLTAAETPILEKLADRDPILAAKTKYMRNLIDYFAKLPETDEQKHKDDLLNAVYAWDADHPRGSNAIVQMRDAKELISQYRNAINQISWNSRTPLMTAILHDETHLVMQMLQTPGIDVKLADGFGWTPLHMAAYVGDYGMVKDLIECGADRTVKDHSGRTPADWARYRRIKIIVDLLEQPSSR